jgi:peptide/nickel transport system permease protein
MTVLDAVMPGSLRSYVLRRCALGVVQVLAVVVLVFALTEALPGDAAVTLAADNPDPALIATLREQLGLDRPAVARFAEWVAGLAQLDLGPSLTGPLTVGQIIAATIGPTVLLATLTLLSLVPAALFLGLYAARRPGSRADRALTSGALALYSVPEFAMAVLLVAVFAVRLGWLPPTAVGVGDLLGQPEVLVLPVLVLLIRPVCSLSRLVRAGMVDVLGSGYVRHARRVGLSGLRVELAHALPNAAAPAVQQLARTADWLVGGVIVVEALFAIPGLGTALVDAVSHRDLPVVQGLALVFATTTVLVNLAADVTARALAPASAAGR